jgi:O-antigen ligase
MSQAAVVGPRPGLIPVGRARRVLYFAFAVAMPLTFTGNAFGGYRTSGWAWLLDLVALAPLVLAGTLPRRAVRYLLPYLAFLAYCVLSLAWVDDLQKGGLTLLQLATPALAYLVAWRASDRVDEVLDRLAGICVLALGLVVALFLAARSGGVAGIEFSLRPVAISLAVLFVVATSNASSWRRTMLIGAVVVTVAVITGSRTAAVVLLVLFLCTPSLALPTRWRVLAAALVVLLLLGLSQTEAFRTRFFFSPDASLVDALTLSPELNTAGRREIWPQIAEACSRAPVTGYGVGASYGIASRLSGGGFGQPHNDYLRTFCDTGLSGSVLFWSFFLAAGIRSARMATRAPSRQLHAAAGLLVLAFLLFALTDNPMVYTAHFMTPLAIILGLSDATWHRTRNPRPRAAASHAPPALVR